MSRGRLTCRLGRALAAVVLACALSPARAQADRPPAAVAKIAQAEFCRHDGDAIPDAACDWRAMALPLRWHQHTERRTSDGWYRLRLVLDAVPERGLAIYTAGFNRSGRLFVNGRYVLDFGAMREPLPLNWNRSQYAVLPPAMLHGGDNEIEIQQRIYWWESGWLAPVLVGPQETLRPLYEQRRFWQNELVRVLGAVTAVTGLFMLGVWLGRRRSNAMYFWFGCACLLWSSISLDYFALVPPLPSQTWERFIECAQVLRAVLMILFILRYCGRRVPKLESTVWAYFLAGTVAMYAGVLPGRYVDIWYLGALLSSPYFFMLLVREGLRNGPIEGVMLGVATSMQIVLSGYDLWLFSGHTWTERLYLAHFSAAFYLFVVGGILMRRFVDSLNAHERLAGELERRIGEKAGELERNYEQLVEARRNEALAKERARIMSEMHDGIGSQLTLALSLVRAADPGGEDGRVAAVLRESIEDLQLIIDSLEPVENDLLTVLGTLRYRLQDRLSRSGIELQWNVVDLPPLPMLTPHGVLSILRIVQEAFANCLKHSGARRIVVATALAGTPGMGETACIRITDDGRGIDGSRVGRGLENMRRRAQALGGHLKIASRPGCTDVLLEIPTLRPASSG